MQPTNQPSKKLTALVTGATSGLGFSAAALLAEAGYAPVIVTGRTEERAEEARAKLVERTGLDVFESLAVDLSIPSDVRAAAASLAARGQAIDLALLNAGLVSGSKLVMSDDDVEITFASSLIGHHQMTMHLLADDALSAAARIVIAGSEAARGDVPTFGLTDLASLAEHFDGDMVAAAESLIRGRGPTKYKPSRAYANAKLFVAWWAASLARQLPEGMTVNAVSPGSAPRTEGARNVNFFMKRVMLPVMKAAPSWMGLAASVDVAAARYVEAADFGPEVNGKFFASAPKKMVGPLHEMTFDHVHDRIGQDAAWQAIVKVARVELPAIDRSSGS